VPGKAAENESELAVSRCGVELIVEGEVQRQPGNSLEDRIRIIQNHGLGRLAQAEFICDVNVEVELAHRQAGNVIGHGAGDRLAPGAGKSYGVLDGAG